MENVIITRWSHIERRLEEESKSRWSFGNVLGPVSSTRIAITKDDVMQPTRNDAIGIHQIPNRLQNGFEVVLLLPPSQKDVERIIHILAAVSRYLLVKPKLVTIKPHTIRDFVSGQHRFFVRGVVIDHFSLIIDQPFDFATSDGDQSNLRDESLGVPIICT